MICSEYLSFYFFISFLLIIHYLFRFDLQLKDWGIDTTQLKELAKMQIIKDWTEEGEKERHKNDAVSKAMFIEKYKRHCV